MNGVFKYADLGELNWPYYLVSTWNPSTAPNVIWLCGPKGSGKSLITYFDGAKKSVEYDSTVGKFLNWEDHSPWHIALDNLHEGKIPYDKILHLLDSISLGYSLLTHKVSKVYLVSRNFPEDTFKDEIKKNGHINGLLGRITNIVALDRSLDDNITIPQKLDFLSNYLNKYELNSAKWKMEHEF